MITRIIVSKKNTWQYLSKQILFNCMGALLVLLFVFCLFTGEILWAQNAGKEKEKEKENEKMWKNQPEKVVINDHLSFLYQQDLSSEISVIHILVRGGKRAVPIARRGLSFITTGLAVEVPTLDDVRQLTQLGTAHFYHVEGDYVTISIRSLSENLKKTLKIISRVINKPLFSGLRISNVKRYMEHRQKAENDSPEKLMELTYYNTFFPSYAGSIYGDSDSIKNIKRKDILHYYRRFFNHSNIIISVSTDISKKDIIPIITENFDSFPPISPEQTQTYKSVQVTIPKKKEIFLEKDNQQVLISFGVHLPGMSARNFVMIYMLENLLGKGIGSKLWPLRSKKELAYSLKTRFTQLKDAGIFTIFLKTDSSKGEEAHQSLKNLIKNIYDSGITPEELTSTKVRSKADFLRDNETKMRRAQWLAYFEAMGVGFDFLEAFFFQVDLITIEDFNAYLRKVLNPDQLLEVVIGPGKKEEG